MKKVIMLAAVVAALVSCQSKGTKAEEAVADSLAVAMEPTMEETQVYEGVLPAADGPGIRYVLTFKGKPVKVEKTVKDKKKTAIKLNPSDGSEPVYFVIANDTTLTLADDSLEVSESDLNYNIIRVK